MMHNSPWLIDAFRYAKLEGDKSFEFEVDWICMQKRETYNKQNGVKSV